MEKNQSESRGLFWLTPLTLRRFSEFGSQFPDFENSLGEPGRDLDLDTAAFENARILFNGWETTDLMDLMKKNV